MKKQEIIENVRGLNLPQHGYVVFGSSPLAIADIRETNDIDLLVSEAVLETLKLQGWKQVKKSDVLKPFVKDEFEAYSLWLGSTYRPTLKQLLATANYVDGVPFASLYEVKKWKQAFNRPKDIDDLKLIEQHLEEIRKHNATITICSSANFYQQAVDIQQRLQGKGYKVIIPATAERMKQSGDFDVSHYKTWFGDESDYYKKTSLMRGHFIEVEKATAILVLNYEKHGVPNYIGGNVLMEMAIAFFLNKPIFILNEVPEKSSFLEEIIGLNPVVLHGRLEDLEIIST